MKNIQKGFTLIELVVVITILGILAAVALPRFIELTDQAHRASVEGVSGALATSVALVHAQWMAAGQTVAVTDLIGFGNDDVDVSANGWPTGIAGNTDPTAITAADCIQLWRGMLQANAPVVAAAAGTDVDYVGTRVGSSCRFTYQLNGVGDYVEYNPINGEVTTFIN